MSIRLGNNIVAGRSAYQPSLFDFKWADHALNDPSWVRADTYNWLYEAAYDVAYDHLVSDITGKTIQSETIAGITITFYLATDGHKICMPNQNDILQTLYDSTGIAWYYILDINNHRFKLPRTKWGFTGLRSQTSVGNYIAAGLPNITGNFRAANEYDYNNADISNKINGVFQVQDFPAKTGSSINQNSTPTGDGVWDITFNASRSSSIYGASNTVQSPATQMYLYFYVGSFSEQALENAADLSINELEEFLDDRVATKQDIATAVNYDNITNCITEIPQDIKLELNNGTLTLKAGSKLYVPNGFESDGTTPKFDVVTIASDIIKNDWGSGSDILFLTVQNGSYIYGSRVSDSGSGTSTESTNGMYYRTNANVIYPNNNTSSAKQSFPIAIVTKTNGVPTSIDQVFNGFGYIGECTFVLPGVKFLCPNGRNTDGSLASIERTIPSVKVLNLTGQASKLSFLSSNGIYGYGVNGYFEQSTVPTNFNSTPYATWYNPVDNYVYVTSDGGSTWTKATDRVYLGVMKKSNGNGNIENLYTKKVFQAPEKINNTQTGSIDVTLDGTYSGVVKYFVKDGWCTVRFWHIVSTATGQGTHPFGVTQQLPLPLGYSSGGANYAIPLCMANNGGQVGMWVYWENNDPDLKCHCYTANANCYGTFTYQIEQ